MLSVSVFYRIIMEKWDIEPKSIGQVILDQSSEYRKKSHAVYIMSWDVRKVTKLKLKR